MPQSNAEQEALHTSNWGQSATADTSTSSLQRQAGLKGLSRVESDAFREVVELGEDITAYPLAQRAHRMSAFAYSAGDRQWQGAPQAPSRPKQRQRRRSVIQSIRHFVRRDGGAQDH